MSNTRRWTHCGRRFLLSSDLETDKGEFAPNLVMSNNMEEEYACTLQDRGGTSVCGGECVWGVSVCVCVYVLCVCVCVCVCACV